MDENALKTDAEAENSQVQGLHRLAVLLVRERIIELLLEALVAKDIWEAMECLMAARGLLRALPRKRIKTNNSYIEKTK